MDVKKQPKVFLRALETFHRNIRSTENDLKDKRMTVEEKTVLKGWFLLRKNKVLEVIDLIKNMSQSQNELVESQKNLLLGICYNNLGHLGEAEKYLLSVPKVVAKYGVKSLEFIAAYNLFICYFNQHSKTACERVLMSMELLRADHYRHELMLQQCRFMFKILSGERDEAEELLKYLDKHVDKMSESMKLGHYYDKFNFYLSQKKLKDCLDCIWEMKKCRSFNLSENFLYMKFVLDLLVHDKPLYVYPQQFKMNPSIFYQLKVIQAIQNLDLHSAKVFWKKLMMSEPNNYFDNYKVKAENSLFALAIKKYEANLSFRGEEIKCDTTHSSKEKIFAELIQNVVHPLPKEVIHQLVWGKELVDKDDMLKLKKLVSRVRQVYKMDIRFKNNCYFIVKEDSEAA